jgi:hypothetical protein
MNPSEMKALVEKMRVKGSLPTLDQVLDAVAETRREYVPKIREARKAAREKRKYERG